MVKLALVGYGAMNKAIHAQAIKHGVEVVSIISPRAKEATATTITKENLNGAEVAIECSVPTAVRSNCERLIEERIPTIVGTTGWYTELQAFEKLCLEKSGTILWSSNFSIGVNLYYKIVGYAASLFNKFPEYDVWGNELHHRNKVDSPSGTAKQLQTILLENIERKKQVYEDKVTKKLDSSMIHFSSTRGGFSNFEHTIAFDSSEDCLSLKHAARNRDGYAVGALQVAEWIRTKKGFFSMESFINDVLQGQRS